MAHFETAKSPCEPIRGIFQAAFGTGLYFWLPEVLFNSFSKNLNFVRGVILMRGHPPPRFFSTLCHRNGADCGARQFFPGRKRFGPKIRKGSFLFAAAVPPASPLILGIMLFRAGRNSFHLAPHLESKLLCRRGISRGFVFFCRVR